MAEGRNISKGIASFTCHGQRLRRCLSDRTVPINFNTEDIAVLKIPRYQSREKENIPILSPNITPEMALSLQNMEGKPLVQKYSVSEIDSDDEMKLSQEFNFDQNNNDSIRAQSSSARNDVHTPPPSPTWNLKMLCEAVSPEIRRMQREKELYAEEGRSSTTSSSTYPVVSPTDENSRDCMEPNLVISREVTATDMDVFTSRKDKSLGKLCDKFLSKYPEYPPSNAKIEICLDKVAKDLAVERRRIYDIVNVLESVEIVSRQAKNRYMWHGKTNLPHTLVKLKMLAKQENIAEQMQKLQEMEGSMMFNMSAGEAGGTPECGSEETTPTIPQRKDNSLGIMSQKFLMLFLVSQLKTVNLELSARLLIDDSSVRYAWAPKFKTKIRRLYDIANILSSLQLIQKIHVTEFRGRKPAFKYIGPDIDDMEDIDSCCNDGCHRPSSRHSLLDCVRNKSYVQSMSNAGFKPIHPAGQDMDMKAGIRAKLQRHKSEGSANRHSSFDEFFKVVENERKLLFNSTSQPPSPSKKLSFEEPSEKKEDNFAVPSLTKHLSFDDHHKSKSLHPIPGKIIHRPKAVSAQAKPKNIIYCTPSPGCGSQSTNNCNKPAETIILTRDGEVKSMGKHKKFVTTPGSSGTLSKSQMDQIFKMTSAPKSSAIREIQFNKPTDGMTFIGKSLLQSPDHEKLNETSPMPGTTFVKRTLKRNMIDVEAGLLGDKRARIELPTPPCGSTIRDSLIVVEEASPSTSLVNGDNLSAAPLRRIKSSPLASTQGEINIKSPHFVIRQVRKTSSSSSSTPTTQIRVRVASSNEISAPVTIAPSINSFVQDMDIADNVPLTPGEPFQPPGRDSASHIPIRILKNQNVSSFSLLGSKKILHSSHSQVFHSKNSDSFSTSTVASSATKSVPQVLMSSSSRDMNMSSQSVGFKKVIATGSSLVSASPSSGHHSSTSPFKVVLPSAKNGGGPTTFLVKIPHAKLSKMASM